MPRNLTVGASGGRLKGCSSLQLVLKAFEQLNLERNSVHQSWSLLDRRLRPTRFKLSKGQFRQHRQCFAVYKISVENIQTQHFQ